MSFIYEYVKSVVTYDCAEWREINEGFMKTLRENG